ncbi:Polysaccharide biosynthesis protein [Hartmannibacter diazotrophicus]|uniref:Polysaccharide biosynthesis protein n=1 Tax=Hartmannibacter diazotrophicus TaxID=1482074 RepID=A0A2C9D9P4_9HYPH|nr:oligosaccharide flippase family protein [Hartmannibacter diazotrophicus]SON56953.1 Polysaccharide biosynthesis protein [Hartmannibacter diazotrophicus]
MNKNKILLLVSLISRIFLGAFTVLILARSLVPSEYGFLVTIIAYSTIGSLFTDFGFAVQALRDIGAEPHRAGEILAASIRVKNILVLLISLLFAVGLVVAEIPADLVIPSIALYLSVISSSYCDLGAVALRGVNQYAAETYAIAAGAVIFLVLLVAAALLSGSPTALCLALFAGRFSQAFLCFAAVRRYMHLGNCLIGNLRQAFQFAKQSSGLAADSILTVIQGQIDIVLLSMVLSLHMTGSYQIVARLANYVLLPTQVYAGIYIPSLSHGFKNGDPNVRRTERRMILELFGYGTVMGAAFAFIAPIIAPHVFGSAYNVPWGVWLGFGLLLVVKGLTSSIGTSLIARRDVKFRVIGQAASLTVLLTGFIVFVPIFGLVAAPMTLVAASLSTLTAYVIGVLRSNARIGQAEANLERQAEAGLEKGGPDTLTT